MDTWDTERLARQIAREEIASLCGLVLRRLQDIMTDGNVKVFASEIASIFGEALHDFGGTPDEPGEAA